MQPAFRHAVIATAALLGLSTGAALAAAPATDATTARPPAAAAAAKPAARPTQASIVDQRIDSLRTRLQIMPVQQEQWDRFAQVMRDNAQRMDETFALRAKSITTASAEDNMASYALVAAAHAQGMQNLVPSFRLLYGTMSDLQKRAADQVFRDDAMAGDQPGRRQGARR